MLKIAIENTYNKNFKGKDLGPRYFMQEYFKENNIELVRVSITHYNKQDNSFDEYCVFNSDGTAKTIKEKYTPDIIRNRKANCTTYKYTLLNKFPIIPSQNIATVANDKYEIYMFLQNNQPKTFLLSSVLKNKQIQSEYTGPMVIKPIRANGGKGIEKTTIQELIINKNKYIGMEELFIVQEFKDFSGGYPGIVEGNHDVRLMFAGKEIIETTLRIPKAGGFKSNIGSGGSQTSINPSNIPAELKTLAETIYQEICPKQNEIISIDFAFCKTENKRYVLEINASPGTRYYQKNKSELEKICKGLMIFFNQYTQ